MLNLTFPTTNEKPKKYFKWLRLGFNVGGISLEDNNSTAFKIYSFVALYIFVFLNTFLDFWELCKLRSGVVTVEYQFGSILATLKVIGILRHRRKLKNLLVKLEQEPFVPNPNRGGDIEEKMVNECVWITNLTAKFYWATAIISLSVSVLSTLVRRIRSSDYHDWEFPFGALTFIDTSKRLNFEIVCLYESIAFYIISINFTTIDLTIAAVLAHISYQFKILQNSIRQIVEKSYEEMLRDGTRAEAYSTLSNVKVEGSTIPWKYLEKILVQNIEYHLSIISIAEELEASFSYLMLSIFVSTLGMMCFSVYNVSVMSLNDPRMWSSVMEVLCVGLSVITICYWGQQVLHESQEVGRAAYESNFVGADLRFQKSLVLIIRRSQNPIALTAGKFTIISLATFTWLLRTSYSAFMVLHNSAPDK